MINRSRSQKGGAHIIIIAILAIALIGMLGFIFWKNYIAKDTKSDNVLTLNGTITSIRRDCHTESLSPIKNPTSFEQEMSCHGGDSIRINDETIYTSSEGADPSNFSYDASSIKPGDIVLVTYVADKLYGLSLNCSECSIIVTEPANR
jgi:hypothetical protein